MQAVEWIANRTASQVIEEREAIIAQLEWADLLMRESGACEDWFRGCDDEVRAVAGDANGYLLEQLLAASDYCDKACVELLRQGAPTECGSVPVCACLLCRVSQAPQWWGRCIVVALARRPMLSAASLRRIFGRCVRPATRHC